MCTIFLYFLYLYIYNIIEKVYERGNTWNYKIKSLKKAICYKIGEFGDYELQREDLLKVEELNLNNRTFSGKEKDIDLTEIQALSNLKNISLQYFKIDDSIAEILNSLSNLSSYIWLLVK